MILSHLVTTEAPNLNGQALGEAEERKGDGEVTLGQLPVVLEDKVVEEDGHL